MEKIKAVPSLIDGHVILNNFVILMILDAIGKV